jgi:hypothetical protein
LTLNLSYSQSQYPTVKQIGNDSVLIITLKQGDEMNKKFLKLSDSIKLLNKKLGSNPNYDTLIARHGQQIERMHFNFTAERLEKEMYKTELEEADAKFKIKEDRLKKNMFISHIVSFTTVLVIVLMSGSFNFW